MNDSADILSPDSPQRKVHVDNRAAHLDVRARLLLIPSLVFADLDADVSTGKKLLAEGDELADKGDTTEAVVRYKRAFEQLLPGCANSLQA